MHGHAPTNVMYVAHMCRRMRHLKIAAVLPLEVVSLDLWRHRYPLGIPDQCHRCQLYGHLVANCHEQPCCVTKDCDKTKESGGIGVKISPRAAGGDAFPTRVTSQQQVRETTFQESPKSSSIQTGPRRQHLEKIQIQ
ncbi:hypothetical protein EVAR_95293_1 [Eumeta japonica]|uniref:Nucleic-acid-binding protein from transposon X-element n=1 Tax=Eumeta variegata TaxID=151549 RepID=A0A4C1U8Y1_EUMVA|nr:hypothetical protein EVAR_95293_1 [Eumeta japonica]